MYMHYEIKLNRLNIMLFVAFILFVSSGCIAGNNFQLPENQEIARGEYLGGYDEMKSTTLGELRDYGLVNLDNLDVIEYQMGMHDVNFKLKIMCQVASYKYGDHYPAKADVWINYGKQTCRALTHYNVVDGDSVLESILMAGTDTNIISVPMDKIEDIEIRMQAMDNRLEGGGLGHVKFNIILVGFE